MERNKAYTPEELLKGNPYPGRGIMVGKTPDGKSAVSVYFIMGRSANSRNRIFAMEDGVLKTKAYDESKVEDPSLIIYSAVKAYVDKLVVTNGDHTDTIVEGLEKGRNFSDSLRLRTFEPDAPNYTPRISAMLTFSDEGFSYEMSILKSVDAVGSGCIREFFEYPAVAGEGHFIHTYATDGNPIPSFVGEPEKVKTEDDIDAFVSSVWENLDGNNRISLYVRYTDLSTGKVEERIINRNK